jgi:hypothetical protein
MRLFTAVALMLLAAALAWTASSPAGDASIASRYPGDRGIGRDPAVIFADDFEGWGADGKGPGRWTGLHNNSSSFTCAVPGKVTVLGGDGPGERVLAVQCWGSGGGSATGGVFLHLGNYVDKDRNLGLGYEEIYVRYYVMFDPTYKPMANHGANLGGRDLSSPGARWVGQANTRDVAGQRYFFSGLQPTDSLRDFHLFFYSYHMDKPDQWGDVYPVQKKIPIKLGRWTCVERHMKLNTVQPLKADGVEELWVDGELSIRRGGLRFRNIPTLRINLFSLETYYHHPAAEWTREHPVKVYFDDVVVARSYVGPIAGKGKPASSGKQPLPPGWDPSDRN